MDDADIADGFDAFAEVWGPDLPNKAIEQLGLSIHIEDSMFVADDDDYGWTGGRWS